MKVLVTAIGSLAAGTVIDSLRRLDGIDGVLGCDVNPGNWLPARKKVDAFTQVPYAREIFYGDWIQQFCLKHRIELIIPLTDPEVDYFAAHRAFFEELGVRLGLGPTQSITQSRDKRVVCSLFSALPSCRTIPCYSSAEVLGGEVSFPVIGKPPKGRSSEGICYFHSREEAGLRGPALEDMLLQPVLEGPVFTVDFVRGQAGEVFSVTRKELLRTINGAGVSVQICEEPLLDLAVREIAGKLQFVGCGNIEFIYSDGKFYLMDINPRFSAGVGFSELAGYDMVANHLRALQGWPLAPCGQVQSQFLAREGRICRTDESYEHG